jgi:hypothetical protein
MTIIKCVTVAAVALAYASLTNAQVLVPTPYTSGSSTDGLGGWQTSPLTLAPAPYDSAPIPGWTRQDGGWAELERSGRSGSVGSSWRPSAELFTR